MVSIELGDTMPKPALTDDQKLMALGMALRMLRAGWIDTTTMTERTPQQCLDEAIVGQIDSARYAETMRAFLEAGWGPIASQSFVQEALSRARQGGSWPDWTPPWQPPAVLDALRREECKRRDRERTYQYFIYGLICCAGLVTAPFAILAFATGIVRLLAGHRRGRIQWLERFADLFGGRFAEP